MLVKKMQGAIKASLLLTEAGLWALLITSLERWLTHAVHKSYFDFCFILIDRAALVQSDC